MLNSLYLKGLIAIISILEPPAWIYKLQAGLWFRHKLTFETFEKRTSSKREKR